MRLVPERRAGALILKASGRLDSAYADRFQEHISGAITPEDRTVILDLAGIEFMNSAGLQIVLRTAKALDKAGGKLAVSGMSEQVYNIFKTSGFDQIIEAYGSTQSALDSLT